MSDPQASGASDELVELLVPIVEPLIDRQETLEQNLTTQKSILVEVVEQLEHLQCNPPAEEPSPWNLYQGDPAQVAKLLEEIHEWIPWFNTTYGAGISSNMIPSCWFLHPNVAAQLMGLYTSWKAANYGIKNPNNDLVYWNVRYLPDVLDIVNAPADKGGMAGCRREHRAPDRTDPVPEPLTDDFTQWLAKSYPLEQPAETNPEDTATTLDQAKTLEQ